MSTQRCEHDGFHSGEGRYDQDSKRLRYIVVCDACQAELREVHVQDYRPEFNPRGNDGFSKAA
jgi:hypothetical protein